MSQLKVATLVSVLFLLASTYSIAQGPCPTANSTVPGAIPPSQRSGDLVCLIAQVYGPGGLVGSNKNGPLLPTSNVSKPHEVHFIASSLESFTPLNAEIGTQLSQLPLTSPASGFVFSFNPSLGVVSRTTESFGPILTERAETIGKHKLFLGVSYQFFDFNKVDGVNLRKFGTVFQHQDVPPCKGTETAAGTCDPLFPISGVPTLENDIIDTTNNVSLKVHQTTAVATFGLTNALDVSVAVPILDVRMGVASDATIISFEPPDPVITAGNGQDHQFETPSPTFNAGHETVVAPDHALFYNARSTFGIGDVIFRGKFQVLKKEKTGLAIGLDLHAPTGDEKNFLGSGTWGVRPFAAFSYAARVEPHATFGYQRNGDSILAGDITRFTKGHLPDVLTYSFGADAGVTRRFSVSGDFIGQSLLSAKRIIAHSFTDFHSNTHSTIVTSGEETINQASIAVGGKVNPVGKLLISLNVLFRVNDAGLHSKPAPLIGVSYTF